MATVTCEVGLTIRSRAIPPEEARCYGLAPHVNWRATHMLEVHMVDRRFLVLPAVSRLPVVIQSPVQNSRTRRDPTLLSGRLPGRGSTGCPTLSTGDLSTGS